MPCKTPENGPSRTFSEFLRKSALTANAVSPYTTVIDGGAIEWLTRTTFLQSLGLSQPASQPVENAFRFGLVPVFWNSLFDIQIGRKRNVDGFVLADRAPLRGGSMRQLTVTYLKYHRSRRCEAREQVCLGLVNKTADSPRENEPIRK